jgi:hypothetical protein
MITVTVGIIFLSTIAFLIGLAIGFGGGYETALFDLKQQKKLKQNESNNKRKQRNK